MSDNGACVANVARNVRVNSAQEIFALYLNAMAWEEGQTDVALVQGFTEVLSSIERPLLPSGRYALMIGHTMSNADRPRTAVIGR